MASLLRSVARQGCRALNTNTSRHRRIILPVSYISTSKKNKDAASVSETIPTPADSAEERLDQKEENWISYGYDLTDRENDEFSNHLVLFCGITIAICWGGFMMAYMPDHRLRDWSQREAFLELARREAAGEPLIDRNFISEDRIALPSDEELGDFDIVI